MGNQNPYIEWQTTQWPKEKVPKDKQRSTKHTHRTKDRATRTPLKTGDELRCSGRVRSSCSTSGTRRVYLVIDTVISHEWGKDREVFATSGTYYVIYDTYILVSNQVIVTIVTLSKWWLQVSKEEPLVQYVASLLAATLYQGNLHRKHKLWNIVSSERYTFHM